MKKNSELLHGALRILATASVGTLAVAPFLVITASALCLPGAAEAWRMTGICEASILLGLLAGWLLGKTKIPPWARDVILALFAGAWYTLGLVLPWRCWLLGIGTGLFAGALAAAAWLIGARFSHTAPGIVWVLGGGGTALFCTMILRLSRGGRELPLDSLVWTVFVLALFVTLCANYENVDRHMARRGHSRARLPGHVRQNNLILVLALFTIGAVLLLLRRPIGAALGAAIKWMLHGIGLLLSLLGRLLPDRAAESGTAAAAPKLEGYASQEESGGSGIGYTVFCALVLAAGIVFLVPKLAAKVRESFRRLKEAVRRWLRRVSAPGGQQRVDAGDYTDMTESVSAPEPTEGKKGKSALRRWRREIRLVRGMPEGRERFIRSYGLILEGLRLSGGESTPGDTATETARRAEKLTPPADMAAAAQSANAVAFSGRETAGNQHAADSVLDALREKN